MEKIFYATKTTYPVSETAVRKILAEYFGIPEAKLERNDNGKPYLVSGELFFSVSHTKELLFIAVSDNNVGIDVENLARKTEFFSIVKKFSPAEQAEIRTKEDFLLHWTAKESAVKWLGGSLARDLQSFRFEKGKLYYGQIELPVYLRFIPFEGYAIAVCGERDFADISPQPLL